MKTWKVHVAIGLLVASVAAAPFYWLWPYEKKTITTTITDKHWFNSRCGAKIYHDCVKYHLVMEIEGQEVEFENRDYSGWYNKVPLGAEVEISYGKSLSGHIWLNTMWYPKRLVACP